MTLPSCPPILLPGPHVWLLMSPDLPCICEHVHSHHPDRLPSLGCFWLHFRLQGACPQPLPVVLYPSSVLAASAAFQRTETANHKLRAALAGDHHRPPLSRLTFT